MHVWQISGLLARESRAQAALGRYGDLFVLNGPDSALLDARAKGRVAAERMVLIGGEVSALMLGFALVCAIGLRRGLAGERRRLLQRGARRLQLWLALGAEVTALTLAGAVVGIAGGAVAVVLLARRAGIPGGAALGHSLGTPLGSLLVLAAWLAATAAVLGAAHLRDNEARRGRVRLVDVAALGALVAVGLGLARGGLDASAASSGNATLLLLLPGLICFVAAVAAARLLGPAMRSSERLSRSGPLPARLALLALARAPSRTVATAAFLLVSLGLALFAAGYRSTLEQGARDEAAYAVPLDFSLTEGSRLVLPLDAAPTTAYTRLAPGTHVYPVLRRTATVPGSGASVLSPTVLGLPVAALARLHWRSDFSASSPSELARRLGADGPAELRGLPLPSGAATVSLPVRIRGVAVRLDLAAVNAENGVVLVPLGQKGPGSWELTARLPAGLRRIVGLEVSLTNAAAFVLQHREAEGVVASAPSGTTLLGPLSAGSRVLTDWHGWVARGGAALTRTDGVLHLQLRADDAPAPPAGDRRQAAASARQSRDRRKRRAGRLADARVPRGGGPGADRRSRIALPRRAGVGRGVRDRRREPAGDRARREPARHGSPGRAVALRPERRRGARRARAAAAAVRGARARLSPRHRAHAGGGSARPRDDTDSRCRRARRAASRRGRLLARARQRVERRAGRAVRSRGSGRLARHAADAVSAARGRAGRRRSAGRGRCSAWCSRGSSSRSSASRRQPGHPSRRSASSRRG